MEVFMIIIVIAFIFAIPEARGKRERVAQACNFNPEMVHGGARFATIKDLKKAGYFRKGGIRIGLDPEGKRPLFYNGFGHLIMVAAARTGKAFTILVAAILSLGRRSLVAFDPKAELTCITIFFRQLFGPVHVLNPYGIHLDRMKGLTMAHYNIMETILDPDADDFHAMCDKIADAFRPADGGHSESHWWNSAAIIISGTIAALRKYGQAEDQNLPAMRGVITGASGRSFFDFCRECMKFGDPFINAKLARFAAPGAEESKELAGILSTADTQTNWLGNEAFARVLKDTTFWFRDLKRKAGMTVYICLPLNTMDVSFQFFALMLMAMLTELLDEGIKGPSVLAIVDEAASIPWFKAWQDAWGMAAGAAGLQIWAIYQSISQLTEQFGKAWSTVVQNSGAMIFFGARDQETREAVSKLAGMTEVISRSHSVSVDRRTGEPQVNDSASQTSRPLLHPDEVGALRDDECLLFLEGIPAVVKAKRYPYLKEFRGKYRSNPYYFEPKRWFN